MEGRALVLVQSHLHQARDRLGQHPEDLAYTSRWVLARLAAGTTERRDGGTAAGRDLVPAPLLGWDLPRSSGGIGRSDRSDHPGLRHQPPIVYAASAEHGDIEYQFG
jgi:hypothetical protein